MHSIVYSAQYLPTYYMPCSNTTSFSFTTYTNSKGLTCLWKNELLFISLPENDSSPVLEAFTWLCVLLNINHNQKAPNLYKWQDTHRNQEYNLLYFLHPFPISSNAIRFPKTQHWSGHTSNNLRGLPLVLSSHSRHKVHMWPQPTSKTAPLLNYLEQEARCTKFVHCGEGSVP